MNAILFVCTANRIRSPLCEYLFRRQLTELGEKLEDWQIDSAGTWTHSGLPVMPLALEAGSEIGLDLSQHRSKTIDDVALDRYQLIITMSSGHRDAITTEFPDVASRVTQISRLAQDMDYDVADPIGGPLPAYRNTAKQLAQMISLAAPTIIEKFDA